MSLQARQDLARMAHDCFEYIRTIHLLLLFPKERLDTLPDLGLMKREVVHGDFLLDVPR
jgi:hypothetical protein